MTLSRVSQIRFICLLGFSTFFFIASELAGSDQLVLYFPHFADGAGYSTTWQFTGYGFGTTNIDVEVLDKNGIAVPVATDQGVNTVFHLTLNGYGSTSLRTLGGYGSLKTGWARITASQSIGAMETFEVEGTGGINSKASVLPSGGLDSTTLIVPNPAGTAIALATGSSNTLSFRLLDSAGNVAGTSTGYLLSSNSQMATFLSQLPGLENVNITDGSLEISGTAQFYVTSLIFEGQHFAAAPVLHGRYEPAGSRNALLNDFVTVKQDVTGIGDQLLLPSDVDLALFATFLSQPQTGLIRLLPRENYEGYLSTRGGGSYYSFALRTHEYGNGSDLGLEQGSLSVGFAGANFGFLTTLGDAPINGITLDTPGVQFLASFSAPTTLADARTQQERASTGFSAGAYNYINRMKATSATTFALRSVCYDTSDVLVAFRVTRLDTDSSTILVWKILKTFAVPRIQ